MSTPAAANYVRHRRVTISGDIGAIVGSPERWSIRLNFSDPTNFADGSNFHNGVVADVKLWASLETGLWIGSRVSQVKSAVIGTNGLYTGEPFVDDFAPVPFAGSAQVPLFPFQVSLCMSLQTGQRGPRKRGRVYLPTPMVTLEPDGQFQAGQATAIRDRFATFLNNLNNHTGPDANAPEVVIASSKGLNTVVNGVRVGRVLDTMRSRRRSLPEDYTALAAVS